MNKWVWHLLWEFSPWGIVWNVYLSPYGSNDKQKISSSPKFTLQDQWVSWIYLQSMVTWKQLHWEIFPSLDDGFKESASPSTHLSVPAVLQLRPPEQKDQEVNGLEPYPLPHVSKQKPRAKAWVGLLPSGHWGRGLSRGVRRVTATRT